MLKRLWYLFIKFIQRNVSTAWNGCDLTLLNNKYSFASVDDYYYGKKVKLFFL